MAAIPELFGKIPKHGVIIGTASEVFQQPSRCFRRLGHVFSSLVITRA